MVEPVVVVHGGAWAIPEMLWTKSIEGVKAAACQGYKVLKEGGSTIDAAEASVISLEDCPVFDAGTGAVLTFDEQVEMDAIIMDGTTMKAGAVGAIRNIKNPVKVARLVMEKTPHVLLVVLSMFMAMIQLDVLWWINLAIQPVPLLQGASQQRCRDVWVTLLV